MLRCRIGGQGTPACLRYVRWAGAYGHHRRGSGFETGMLPSTPQAAAVASHAWAGAGAIPVPSPTPTYASGVVGLSTSTPASAVPNTAPSATRVFWTHPVQYTAPADLKRRHAFDRAADKRSRFHVRNRLREDGVVSNIFPLHYQSHGDKAVPLYVYEMYVTRKLREALPGAAPGKGRKGTAAARKAPATAAPAAAAAPPVPAVKRVSPSRSWQAIRRALQQHTHGALPPMVQLDYKVYTAAPLPGDALKIPAAFHDLGWQQCELRLMGRYTYADVPPPQMQELMNKIVPWAIAHHASQTDRDNRTGAGDSFTVVREKTGKLVCTTQGIAAGGLRVFKGVLVQALFVDDSAADGKGSSISSSSSSFLHSTDAHGGSMPTQRTPARTPPPMPPHGTPSLANLPQGTVAGPFSFLVDSYVRTITYKGKKVESYYITDVSGKFLASYWEPKGEAPALTVGRVYTATQARVKDYPNRGNLRLFEFTEGSTELSSEEADLLPSPDSAAEAASHTTPPPRGHVNTSGRVDDRRVEPPSRIEDGMGSSTSYEDFPGRLALKIDTKGTIASETSLWEDVRQHFGPGPYDEETQRRIASSLQGTPVVASYSLRQGIVRLVRFDANAAAEELHLQRSSPMGTRASGGSRRRTAAGHREDEPRRGRSPEDDNAVEQALAPGASSSGSGGGVLMNRRLMDPHLVALLPQLDPDQPWAILSDYTALPLQVLHCCFDPSMKGWQDIAIAALSLMPERRVQLLARFQRVLAEGLQRWGLQLAPEPYRTHRVALLPIPAKETGKAYAAAGSYRGQLRHPPPGAYPTTVLVLGIAGTRCTPEESNKISLTTQQLAAYFKTSLVACVGSEADGVRCMTEQLLTPSPGSTAGTGGILRDPNTAVIVVTPDRESRAARWLMAECLCRGALPLLMPPASTPKRVNLLCANAKRQLLGKFETNPLRGVDLGKNIPVLAHQRVLVVGVDSCHTNAVSTGALVGILCTPERNHLLPVFWRHEARGRETQHVADHFRQVLARAVGLYGGLDQVVVFQDGDVFSELNGMKEEVAAVVPGCGLTFMCLHKRTNIRFVHENPTATGNGQQTGEDRVLGVYNNLVKGNIIPALTPVPLDYDLAAPSFYLQTHESNMSTARTVVYTVHHVSPTLDLSEVQQLANVMANVMAPMATKLPMSTRCAHKLADKAERLLDAVPQMTCEALPDSLRQRLWFL